MTKVLLRSFAGGEIAPEMFGRVELAKFQTGVRKALNMLVLPHGPLARRPGMRHVIETVFADSQARVLPFAYSVEESAALEFGDGYIRFHRLGQTILEANKNVTAMTTANPAVFTSNAHGYADGDKVYFNDVVGPTALNARYFTIDNATANTYTLVDLYGNAVSSVGLPAYVLGGTTGRVYTLETDYAAADIFDLHIAQDSDTLTITHPSYPTRELRRVAATNWTLTDSDFTPTLAAPTGVSATPTVAVSTNLTTQYYVVTAVSDDLLDESVASAVVNCSNNLTLAGNFNTIAWSAVTGAARYNVYKRRGGVMGYIGQTTGLSLVDDNVTPDTVKTPPEIILTLNTEPDDYASTVTFHEQRRMFAGTNFAPQTIVGTRNGTTSNLTNSVPTRDDDALEFRIAALQQNRIRHLVPLGDLFALTAGAEFRVFSGDAPSITPTAIAVKPIGYSGANNVQPVVTSSTILYVQSQGSRVRELGVKTSDLGGTGGYRSDDISLLSPHLFNGYTLRELAYSRAPDQVLWCIRSDGVMLTMSYVPEQQVYAWAQHSTDGFYESVCVVPENNEDAVYVVVRRTVNGQEKRFIERMSSRIFVDQKDAYFVDCGATYNGTLATTISGLHHIEGKTVQILADGAVHPPQVVTNGAIVLEAPAEVVHVGLGYNSDVQTLPLALEGAEAFGQGTLKNINAVHLRVTQTSSYKAGPSFNKLTPNRDRMVSDNYDSPPALQTVESRVAISGTWGTDGSVCMRQDSPLPFTVLAMVLEVEPGG